MIHNVRFQVFSIYLPVHGWRRFGKLSVVSALIPIIRRVSPRTKIIYRSHIQSERLRCSIGTVKRKTDCVASIPYSSSRLDRSKSGTTNDNMGLPLEFHSIGRSIRRCTFAPTRQEQRRHWYFLGGYVSVASSRRACSSNRQRFDANRLHASFVLPSLLNLRSWQAKRRKFLRQLVLHLSMVSTNQSLRNTSTLIVELSISQLR